MSAPQFHDSHEGASSLLDSLTREQLDEAGREYDETKQRIDIAPTTRQLLGRFTVVCMVMNRTIGSGIFTTPPKVLAGTGSVGGALTLWAFGGVVAICGTLCWLELGLSIPFYKIRDNNDGTVYEVSAPRSGGEKIFLEYIFNKPRMFMTCMFGIMFLILGNISGNAIAFGFYVAIAAGKDPIYDEENNYNKGLVIGLAIMTLTACASLHIFTRRGGILINNVFAIVKVSMILALAILGFVHAGGKYLQASGINEPAIPHLLGGNFNITDAQINNATKTNFVDAFASGRHDLASYVDSLVFVLSPYTGFEQPFYVLSEVSRPRKVFPKYVLLGMIMATCLYTLVNVSYFCVVPKEVYTTSPTNSLNMAGAFLHYLFDNSYGQQTAERVMAGLIAVSILGSLLVMTFTAARVKQEIAKEGILPWSLFFASGHTTPWAWLKSHLTDTQQLHREDMTNGVNLENHLEKTPMAALALHWCTAVFLVLVTISLNPATQYSFLTALYSYFYHNVIGGLVSGGLLYLKLEPFIKKNSRNWSSKANFIPLLSPVHAVVYFLASVFLLVGSFIKPGLGSIYSSKIQGYAWFIVPTIGLSSLSWGVFWWIGLKGIEWRTRRAFRVNRTPYIERDEDGNYVQKAELVEHDRPVIVLSDMEMKSGGGFEDHSEMIVDI